MGKVFKFVLRGLEFCFIVGVIRSITSIESIQKF